MKTRASLVKTKSQKILIDKEKDSQAEESIDGSETTPTHMSDSLDVSSPASLQAPIRSASVSRNFNSPTASAQSPLSTIHSINGAPSPTATPTGGWMDFASSSMTSPKLQFSPTSPLTPFSAVMGFDAEKPKSSKDESNEREHGDAFNPVVHPRYDSLFTQNKPRYDSDHSSAILKSSSNEFQSDKSLDNLAGDSQQLPHSTASSGHKPRKNTINLTAATSMQKSIPNSTAALNSPSFSGHNFSSRLRQRCREFFYAAAEHIRTRNRWVIAGICVGALVLVLLIVFLIIFYGLWRGIPSLDILGAEKTTDKPNSGFNIVLGDSEKPTVLVLDLNLRVQVTNDNLLDLSLVDIGVLVYHPLLPNVALGTTVIPFLSLPKSSVVNLTLPMQLSYSFDSDPTYAVPNDLVQSCTVPLYRLYPVKLLSVNVVIKPNLRLTNQIQFAVAPLYRNPSFLCPFSFNQTLALGPLTIDLAHFNWGLIARGLPK